MASLIRPTRPYPLPANPEIVQKNDKPHVRIGQGRKVLYPITKDGKKYLKRSAKWYGKFRGADGTVQCVPLSPNKDAAQLMLAELVKKTENEKVGIRDPFEKHRKKTLPEHLNDWLASLRANGRDPKYVALKASRVRAVADGCGWTFTSEMTADRLETFLVSLREDAPAIPPLPCGTEWFTIHEVSELLGGVTRHHAAYLIRKNKLSGIGRGKTRRFSRETVETLRSFKDRGRSAQTSNHYLQAFHQFARWLTDNGRIERNPFTRLKPLNARLDTRRRRGELTTDEVGALLAAASTSTVLLFGLGGEERALLYRLALATGLRAAELGALQPEHFDWAATPSLVALPPELTKNRKGAIQPIPDELIADLRTFVSRRPTKSPVWPGRWSKKAAEMLRADLDGGGVPIEVDGPEGAETRDFHALRACYISNIIRAGADLKQVMTLARHSDPRLTASRYARTRLHDLGTVVNKLPGSVARTQHTRLLSRTGIGSGGTPDVPADVPAGGKGQGQSGTDDQTANYLTSAISKPLVSQGFGDCREPAETTEKEASPGFEPGMTVLQTVALPLGDEAINQQFQGFSRSSRRIPTEVYNRCGNHHSHPRVE